MPPLVSIGLPIYNGERFLRAAIESILGQTFTDFELILCDNASTDSTQAICEVMAAADSRVRYHRNRENLGASRNFNLTVELAQGELFRWAADDDVLDPSYLEKCVAVLRDDPTVVAVHSDVQIIDEQGEPLTELRYPAGYASSTDPVERLDDLLRYDRWCYEVFGLFRLDVFRQTRLLDRYVASDRVLRSEIGLRGRWVILPELLFLNRDHPGRSVRANPAHHLRGAWFDPAQAGKRILPHWKIFREYRNAVAAAPLTDAQKTACRRKVYGWALRDYNWARMGADLVIAAAPGAWGWISRITKSGERWLKPRPK